MTLHTKANRTGELTWTIIELTEKSLIISFEGETIGGPSAQYLKVITTSTLVK